MEIDNALRFHCERRGYDLDFGLYIGRGHPVREVAAPMEFVPHVPHTPNDAPALKLRDEDAQALIDALWSAGLRPTQGKQSEGAMNAQAAHLSDMRALAFAKLKVEPPSK